MKAVNGGVVGFFSCEMSAEQLATRILAEQTGISSSMIRRGGITQSEFDKIRDYTIELQHLPLYVDETGGLVDFATHRPRPPAEAAEGPRSDRGRLHPAAAGLGQTRQRQPRAGSHRDHHQPEGAGEGAQYSGHRAVAAVAPGRKPRRQASAIVRPARIRFDRAGRRRRDVRLPRGILSAEQGAEARHARTREVAARNGAMLTARPKSSSPSSATGRRAPCHCSSRANSRASAIWRKTANCRHRRY